jgi:cytochrome c peroxidase
VAPLNTLAQSFRSLLNIRRPGRAAIKGLFLGVPVTMAVGLTASYIAFAALPPVPQPPENPITPAKRLLGKVLFWDEQMSSSNVVSCGSCHSPARGGADDRLARNPGRDGVLNTPDDILGSPGIIRSDFENDYERDTVFALNPQITGRSANSPIDAAYAPELFWDGRARSQFLDPQTGQVAIANGGALESQAAAPPENNVEMAHAGFDWDAVCAKLRRVNPLDLATTIPPDVATALAPHPSYPDLFRAAFGDEEITARRVAFAIATYQRTLIADQTPWDRFQAGETTALTQGQQQGMQAFATSRCNQCHTGPLFTDQTFRNLGLRPIVEDTGRQIVTNNNADRGKFKVPSLRNVGLKRTFMHNGMFQSLTQVIQFYARAPGAPIPFQDNRDPVLNQVNVPPPAAILIQDFLQNGLTDPRVVNQAFPFDRPTLFTNRPGNQSTILGGGTVGTGNIVPRIIVQAPPMIGNLDYRLGLDGALGGSSARLGISFSPPVNGRITPVRLFDAQIAEGFGAGFGLATLHWPLTIQEVSPGQVLFAQWFVTDPAAAGGTALSTVARIPVFCGSYGCPGPCNSADFNHDGGVDGADIDAFFEAWEAGEISGDVNVDGGIDGADVETFFAVWTLGGC